MRSSCRCPEQLPYLLLFHQLRIRTIVDNILAENWCGKGAVNILGVDMAEFAIQDELVALGANIDSSFLAEQDKGENVAILESRVSHDLTRPRRPLGWHTFSLHSAKNLTGSMP
jgi:hypothetical protein